MSQTVVVFQEDCILAAAGQEGKCPALSRVRRIGLKGQGDSFERWRQALEQLEHGWKQEPVRVILPANLCSTRVLPLPNSRGRQFMQLAAREIADSFHNEIADYSVVYRDKKNPVDICAGGIDRGNLERFVEICQETGITLDGITVPLEGYLRVLQQLESYWNRTAIYLFFEEGSMTSVLCQNGRYLYSTRSRLFSEPGTWDFGTEIVRSISGILQFYAGSKREMQITEVYYAGCLAEDFEVSVKGIQSMELQVFPLVIDGKASVPAGELATAWIPCIGAMLGRGRKEKQIDLYRVSLETKEDGEQERGIWRHLLLPGLSLALCLIPVLILAALNGLSGREIRAIQDWMEKPEIQQEYGEALDLKARLDQIQKSLLSVKQTDQNLSTYPELSSSVLHRIESAGGSRVELKVTGFDANTGVLTFHVSSREVIDGPSYILRLQDTGLFHTVDYSGYLYDNEWYQLSLSCTLAGAAEERAEGGGK